MQSRTPGRFQCWWLIWVAGGLCLFLCGALLGGVTGGGARAGSHGLLEFFAPPFGGRERVSILAVGVDNSEGRGLADTIIALAVWPKTGEMAAVAIPRDSYVHIPGVGNRRINASHAFGGLPLTMETVELVLGFPFDYYIEVNVEGLVDLVDAIGGVDIEVEKRMYYRDRAQDLLIDLQPGSQHLGGKDAVGYVRFRHDAMGDLGRIERQRQFLRSVTRELLSPDNVSRLPGLAESFVETVQTNLNVRDILMLKRIVEQIGADGIRMATVPATPIRIADQSVLQLDPVELQRLVDRVLWGQGIRVVVLNGTSVNGLASRTAEKLKEHGYDVLEVGNAEHRTETTVILDHRGHARRAERVASAVGCGVISADPDGDNPADVTIILGSDIRSRL
ncbi:MAG: LCP family protein [Armatimonadetes bacterium]|nr:LCP family protein [Armatimonadota bacterium]